MLQHALTSPLGRSAVLTLVTTAMVALLSPATNPNRPCKPGELDACKPQGCCIVNVQS